MLFTTLLFLSPLVPGALCLPFSISTGAAISKINKYLTERASDDDLKKNVELARCWMTKIKLDEPLFVDKKLLKSLELFSSLRNTWELSGGCTFESYEILRKNNEFFGGGRNLHQTTIDVSSLDRLGRIVHAYSTHHANFCKKAYPEMFRSMYRLVNPEPLLRLKEIFKLVYKRYQEKKKPDQAFKGKDLRTFEELVSNPKLFDDLDFIGALLESIRELSENDPDRIYLDRNDIDTNASCILLGNSSKRRSKLISLLESYLLTPCKSYIRSFKIIFKPAEYDMELTGELEVTDRITFAFRLGFIKYRFCQRLNDQAEVIEIASSMEKSIDMHD